MSSPPQAKILAADRAYLEGYRSQVLAQISVAYPNCFFAILRCHQRPFVFAGTIWGPQGPENGRW